ncbi:MAG: sigma-70 family RNA polymerase sigma factor [Chloroflexota bacterium]
MSSDSHDRTTSSETKTIQRLLEEYVETRRLELRDELIVLHLDLVSRLARQLAGRTPILDDLIQVGYIGLMKAIDRFEPERNVPFIAYAIPTIDGEMKRYLRDKGPIIHIPRQIQEQRLDLERAVDRLTQKLHRPPADLDIAADLGWDVQRVISIRCSELARPVSLDRVLSDVTDEPSTMPLGDVIPLTDDDLARSEDRVILGRLIDSLSPRQRAILYLLFYEDLSQAEIGERLKISQMHVSRLARAALERLRGDLERETGGL